MFFLWNQKWRNFYQWTGTVVHRGRGQRGLRAWWVRWKCFCRGHRHVNPRLPLWTSVWSSIMSVNEARLASERHGNMLANWQSKTTVQKDELRNSRRERQERAARVRESTRTTSFPMAMDSGSSALFSNCTIKRPSDSGAQVLMVPRSLSAFRAASGGSFVPWGETSTKLAPSIYPADKK